jgi:hypothetical protein
MRKIGLFLSVVLLLVLIPSSLLAQAVVSRDVIEDTISYERFNECTGEIISGEADLRVVTHQVTNAKRASYKYTISFDGSAVGQTSGTEYRVKEGWSYQERWDIDDEYPHNGTYPLHLRFISKGSSDNLIMKARFMFVWDANGELRVEMSNYSWECRG